MSQKQKGYKISSSDSNLRIYEPNQFIIHEGEPYDGNVYILRHGRLAVLLNNQKVTEITDSGVFIGEISCVLGCPRTATVQTLEESEIIVCKGAFEGIIESLPSVANKIIAQMAIRLKNTTAFQVDAAARANNLEKMYYRLREQYIELRREFDELKQQFEKIKQLDSKKEG